MVAKDSASKPGPGMYANNAKTLGKDAPKFTMGKKQNYSISINTPGPGMYEPNQSVVKEGVRNFKMSTSSRPDVAPKTARDAPGPGQYASQKKFGDDARSVSIRGRP